MNLKQVTLIQGIIIGLLFIVPLIDIIKICPYKIVFPYDIEDIDIEFEFAGLGYDRYAWVIKEEYSDYNLYAITDTIEFIFLKYIIWMIGTIFCLYVLRNDKI